ncbi:DUF6537 domain-containing protein [Bradyrhizobium sp.]|uniref:DUF6537 domain-containing protein n=1 Tax=Bradyrhizobium sp. TaxID=376 RepID=UPI001ECB0772|nr:DUF6537 domain-containing protein [Bradyrhizobium sp.]MBV8918755.1 hypothetical protein [Bradyrhizobium sp.]MBV9981447.1 hypothetical protein [Bradyrhizobium sp.]
MSSLEEARVPDDDGLLSSLRYLFADFLDEQDTTPPRLPDGLPDSLSSIVDDGISLLMDYQGAAYAKLYVERLQRFIGRVDVSPAMLAEIARLLASRMAYQDAIRIAQLKLAQLNQTGVRSVENVRLRFDELVDTLPAVAADPVLTVLGYLGWLHKQVSIPFSTASLWGIRRLKMEAWLRRWRMFSIRYAEERVWVERWLHMIARCLAKQPQSVSAVIQTATMVQGYGDAYRQGLADWHAIIDALAKPTFDGALPLGDLAGAIVEARAAAMPDPRQASLKRSIAQIRARAMGGAVNAAA